MGVCVLFVCVNVSVTGEPRVQHLINEDVRNSFGIRIKSAIKHNAPDVRGLTVRHTHTHTHRIFRAMRRCTYAHDAPAFVCLARYPNKLRAAQAQLAVMITTSSRAHAARTRVNTHTHTHTYMLHAASAASCRVTPMANIMIDKFARTRAARATTSYTCSHLRSHTHTLCAPTHTAVSAINTTRRQ